MSILQQGIVPTSAGGYEIANSLRFNDNDSAYLSWTPSSAGNRKTWTFSAWVKRGNLVNGSFFQVKGSGDFLVYKFNGDDILLQLGAGAVNPQFTTGAKFRDTSAWYHIFVAVDTTQATEADRTKLWINGVQYTLSNGGSSLPQNYDTLVNSTNEHSLGRFTYINSENLDGHMAEVHFIDGQQLDASNFGETGDYGEWKPIKYSGTYGGNGFYLDFENSGSLGADVSGNSNNWTPTNLAATDQMLDSPTNNFCTMNPLDTESLTLQEGNLEIEGFGASRQIHSTILPESGKWYGEFSCNASMTDVQIGIANTEGTGYLGLNANSWGIISGTGNKIHNTSQSAYGSSYTTGDIIMVALDMDNGGWYAGKNGTWFNSGNPATQTNPAHTGLTGNLGLAVGSNSTGGNVTANFGQDSSFAGNKTAQGNADGNGYGDFYYSPPTGYLALCTQNLPDPTVIPSEHFNTVLYTGTGADQSITGVGFQPDWVWLKMRSSTGSHGLFDAVRGATKRLSSNLTATEDTAAGVNSFDSDGFTLDALNWNNSGGTYVSWNWKANGSGVSNTNGSITSTVSANQDAGFSIVSYTGNATAGATVGHGLSSAPEVIIPKNRDSGSQYWKTYWKPLGATKNLSLSETAAAFTDSSIWNNTEPTASVFTVGNSGATNQNSANQLAYCFHSVDGFSKVGSYTGNGSTDGTFVYTGFRPAYVMVKRTDSTSDWYVWDSERSDNENYKNLYPNGSWSENTASSYHEIDLLSNGFKMRDTNYTNANGGSYICYAIAENPFKHTNAR